MRMYELVADNNFPLVRFNYLYQHMRTLLKKHHKETKLQILYKFIPDHVKDLKEEEKKYCKKILEYKYSWLQATQDNIDLHDTDIDEEDWRR